MLVKTPQILQSIFPSLIWRKDTQNKEVWLTFDDGPTPEITPWILARLKEENIRATFFLVGEQIKAYPKLVKAIVKGGHIIANHSYTHKNGWLTSKGEYLEDIEKCQELIPRNNLFRPPYGKITLSQIAALKNKYKLILWDVLSWDFQQNITPKEVQKNILSNTTSGSIIVLHNNKKSFKNLKPILTETIQLLKSKGYTFSTTW